MVQGSYKLFLFFIAIMWGFVVLLETRIGLIVLAIPFLIFTYLYFAKPKFLNESKHWRVVFQKKGYFRSFLVSALFLPSAIFINYITGSYVESTGGPALSDIILSNLKPINFGLVPIYLDRLVMATLFFCAFYTRPTMAPFAIKAVPMLIIVRSICICLTHLGLPAGRIPDEIGLVHIESINFTKDLFFSGHVAIPFMGYLLFRKIKIINYLMLVASLISSFVVLAMHLHYSIDVVAAFFFTYGTYKLTAYLFKKDYELYLTSPSPS